MPVLLPCLAGEDIQRESSKSAVISELIEALRSSPAVAIFPLPMLRGHTTNNSIVQVLVNYGLSKDVTAERNKVIAYR
jgi:hypothetical protein